MNILEFTSAVIGSVVWPVLVLILVLILKKNIVQLFPSIERLKYKDFEIEFKESINKLTEESRTAFTVPLIEYQQNESNERLYQLAEISPRSAILEAWLMVESSAADVLRQRDPSIATKTNITTPLRLGECLNRNQIINREQLEVFHRLRDLRNKAVHVGDAVFEINEVINYIKLAYKLSSQIKHGIYPHQEDTQL